MLTWWKSSSRPNSHTKFNTDHDKVQYLTGLRGLVTAETIVWIFLVTYVQSAVAFVDYPATTSTSTSSVALRKSLSVLCWNERILCSTALILSSRSICIPFLCESKKRSFAESVFRRGIRLLPPVAVAIIINYIISKKTSNHAFLQDFSSLSHQSIQQPYSIPNGLALLNSIFNIFWTPKNFADQAASLAFPTQVLWVISLVFNQSYTVFMTMILIPYTRAQWRLKAYLLFILTAWWVGSWAWYSVTGLAIADATMNMDLKLRAAQGIPIRLSKSYRIRIPSWIILIALTAGGLCMEYLWIDWRPQYVNYEFYGHAENYALPASYVLDQTLPAPRVDVYVFLLGSLLLVETTTWLQKAFSCRILVSLGRRSYSYFLISPLIAWTVCIKIWLSATTATHLSSTTATGLTFISYIVLAAIASEALYRLVDQPSRDLSRWAFKFMTK